MSAAVTIAALPTAFVVIWALLRSTLGRRLVAVPSSERWHETTTPTFGGIGIFCGFLAGVGVAVLADALDPSRELVGVVCGATLIFAAGLVDDLLGLPPIAKLLLQFAAAAIVIAAGIRVEIVANDLIATLIAFVWLVGITNAFNLLDNMDGLAASLATVACAYFAIDAATSHKDTLILMLALSLGFACLGFLPYNLRRKRDAAVFMGDGGSQLLGFVLACAGLAASWTTAGTTVATVLLPLTVLAIPILDTTFVTIIRLIERRPVTQGGRDHTSHRLVYYGMSEQGAVALLTTVAFALGATGLTYNVLDNQRITAVGVLVSVVLLVQFGNFLTELKEYSEEAGPRPSLRRSLLSPRRVIEIVVDWVLMCGSFLLAYAIVVGGLGDDSARFGFLTALPVVLGTRYLCFVLGGIYRRVWRYAAATDELVVAVACIVSAIVSYLIVLQMLGSIGFPASVFALDAVFAFVTVGGARLGFRLLVEWRGEARPEAEGTRVVIVGAGRLGRSFAREARETPGMRIVGFLDDNQSLAGRRIAGRRVLGSLAEADRAIRDTDATEVVVTIADAPADRIALVADACAQAGVPCAVMNRTLEPLVEPAVARERVTRET